MSWWWSRSQPDPVHTVRIFMDCTKGMGNIFVLDTFVGSLMKKRNISYYHTQLVYMVKTNTVKMDVVEAHDQAEIIAHQSSARRIVIEEDHFGMMALCHDIGLAIGCSDEHTHVVVFTDDPRVERVITRHKACCPIHFFGEEMSDGINAQGGHVGECPEAEAPAPIPEGPQE